VSMGLFLGIFPRSTNGEVGSSTLDLPYSGALQIGFAVLGSAILPRINEGRLGPHSTSHILGHYNISWKGTRYSLGSNTCSVSAVHSHLAGCLLLDIKIRDTIFVRSGSYTIRVNKICSDV